MGAPIGNKYAIGNKGGRPPKFKTPQALAKKCDEYFVYIEGEKEQYYVMEENEETGEMERVLKERWLRFPEHPTVTGLALYLGFSNRLSLYDYKEHDEFSDIIKRATTRIEHNYEKSLFSNTPAGSIFALKNMGWQDKTQQEITGKDGAPIAGAVDYSKLSDEVLQQILNARVKA